MMTLIVRIMMNNGPLVLVQKCTLGMLIRQIKCTNSVLRNNTTHHLVKAFFSPHYCHSFTDSDHLIVRHVFQCNGIQLFTRLAKYSIIKLCHVHQEVFMGPLFYRQWYLIMFATGLVSQVCQCFCLFQSICMGTVLQYS